MRNFTKNDWDCYSGCETKNPLIGKIYVGHCGETVEAEIILDGSDLQIFGSFGENPFECYAEFPSYFFCKMAAEKLEGRTHTVAMLESMGFKVML